MAEKRATIRVEGMTCSACEARIAGAVRSLRGVKSATASLHGGKVEVAFDDLVVSLDVVKAVIVRTGYVVREKENSGGATALGVGMLLVALYMIANSLGLFSALPSFDSTVGYGMLFVAGLLTSVHCVAMCGGIALSQSVKTDGAGRPEAAVPVSRIKTLAPGLLYNAGRVISYTIVGGIAGALGAAFSVSPRAKGIVAAVAGIFMLFMGLKMLGYMPRLPRLRRITREPHPKHEPRIAAFLPASLYGLPDRIRGAFKNRGSFAVGLLGGLMPCGPLQTMQLYALGTGGFFAGAMSMLVFSAGTVPLMLSFGIAAAALPRKFLPAMVRASAVLVMFLGLLTLGRAAALAGVALPYLPSSLSVAGGRNPSDILAELSDARESAEAVTAKAVMGEGIQTFVTDFGVDGYAPFTVRAGVPFRWIINATAEDLNPCNNPLIVPSYGIEKELVPGENVIEFTPKKPGAISYSCWMGMIRSRISVVSGD
ncbi:MAG: sulfite exporter TauE/SafE family protein [Rectinemataceae bacterium]